MKKVIIYCILLCYYGVAYCQPGRLDPSFGTRGIVHTSLGKPITANSIAIKALFQADGSFYLLVQSDELAFVIKKKADGSTDLSYGVDGYSSSLPIYAGTAAQQPDGKILIVGSAKTIGQYIDPSDFAIARINIDGSLDQSFDGDGILTGGFGGQDHAGLISIQNDGKFLVVVTSDGGWESPAPVYELLRFSPDGSPDGVFKRSTDYNVYASSIAIQADGKILLAGDSLQRFNSDLTLDTSFNGTGTTAIPIYAQTLNLQDGKIMLTGVEYDENNFVTGFRTMRYNTNGSIDSTFGTNGSQLTGSGWANGWPRILVQPDGKILFSGSATENGVTNIAINRYNNNGQVDSTFSSDGKLITNLGSNAFVVSPDVLHDGSILLSGYTSDGVSNLAVTIRYNNMGIPDDLYDSDGISYETISRGSTYFNATAVQTDGKLVAAGYSWNGKNYDFALVRYNVNGSLDVSFSGDGMQLTDLDSLDDKINAIAIQGDGKIVVAGSAGSDFGICRFNTDGSLDPSFDFDGINITDFGSMESIDALSIQADGRILAGGTLVARFNADGSRDLSFGQAGVLPVDCNDIALQKDGKVIIVGEDGEIINAYRYDANGAVDSSYGEYGVRIIYPTVDVNKMIAKSIKIQNDEKLIITGYHEFEWRGGTYYTMVIRLNDDGTTDGTFNNGQPVFGSFDNYSHAVSMALQSAGQILIGGYSYNGSSENFTLARYNPDGSIDNAFNNSGSVITQASPGNDRIAAILVSADSLYAGGSGQYNHGNEGVVARYLLGVEGAAGNFFSRADGNWNDPNTWLGGIVPSATSQVVIQHAVTITADASCYSLSVQPPAGSLVVSTGVNLTITH